MKIVLEKKKSLFLLLHINIILKNVLICILVPNTKDDILKNVGNQTVAVPHWLPFFVFLLSKSVGTSNCLVTHILQNIFFCDQDKTTN